MKETRIPSDTPDLHRQRTRWIGMTAGYLIGKGSLAGEITGLIVGGIIGNRQGRLAEERDAENETRELRRPTMANAGWLKAFVITIPLQFIVGRWENAGAVAGAAITGLTGLVMATNRRNELKKKYDADVQTVKQLAIEQGKALDKSLAAGKPLSEALNVNAAEEEPVTTPLAKATVAATVLAGAIPAHANNAADIAASGPRSLGEQVDQSRQSEERVR